MYGSHVVRETFSGKWLLAFATLILTLAVNNSANAVTVTSQPSSLTVNEGQSVSFTIVATSKNSSAITYTWYKNNVAQSVTGNTYTIASAKSSDAATYRCTVKDSTSTYKCKSFTLTVKAVTQPVSITQQPANIIISEGTSTTLSVTATGSGTLSYQWYLNSQALSGATASTLTISNATTANAGNYYVVVRNASSSATSATATLTILAVPKTWSVQLSWTRPTLRESGTVLASSDISSYQIYYATSSTGSLTLLGSTSASSLSYLVSALTAGTHYFAVSARDTTGLESLPSIRQSLTFQ